MPLPGGQPVVNEVFQAFASDNAARMRAAQMRWQRKHEKQLREVQAAAQNHDISRSPRRHGGGRRAADQ